MSMNFVVTKCISEYIISYLYKHKTLKQMYDIDYVSFIYVAKPFKMAECCIKRRMGSKWHVTYIPKKINENTGNIYLHVHVMVYM